MLIFLGLCFLLLTLALTKLEVSMGEAKMIVILYLAGLILVDLAILTMMGLVWAMEHGKL